MRNPPPSDAEKVSPEQLEVNFRQPPQVGRLVSRSTLLVGSRGSGKTLFLRRQKQLHSGIAWYGNLRKILISLFNDLGTLDHIPPSVECPLQAKAIGVLVTWLAVNAEKSGLAPPVERLFAALPVTFRGVPAGRTLQELADAVASSELLDFDSPAPIGAFVDLVDELGMRAVEQSTSLMLLLDRAEEMPYPCLRIVLTLLDQSRPFRTVVAARPGIVGASGFLDAETPAAGDHFTVQHLGGSPYSSAWNEFQIETLKAWAPEALEATPRDDLTLLVRLGRDSIRNMLELVYHSVSDKGRFSRDESHQRISLLRDQLQSAAQGRLRRVNDDLGALVSSVRRRTTPFFLPVLLRMPGARQLLLEPKPLQELTRDERFTHLALRVGFLVMPENRPWHPHAPIEEVELAPLFVWRVDDEWFDTQSTS